MCGIAGFINVRPENSETILKKMADLLKHRGPDAEGFYEDDFCSFAHRRLKIVDLDNAANQPMIDAATGDALVFNGEIYNFKELKADLEARGVLFVTKSDTEVLLKGLNFFGESFIEKLEGDFAFAFRSQKNKQVLLARDRFGVKPLYIFKQNHAFIFSSEIKPLFAAGVKKEINKSKVKEYFKFRYVGGTQTLFDNIECLPPGHFYKIRTDSSELICYFDSKTYFAQNKSVLNSDFADVFKKSVGDRLNADVPVGVFLSGGIDSGAILAQCQEHSAKVTSFTFSFKAGYPLDESDKAAELAKQFGLKNKVVKAAADLHRHYRQAIFALEEPIGDAIITANYELFEKAKDQMTVALSGEGADEIFSGYAHHRATKALNFLRRFYFLRTLSVLILKLIPLSVLNKISLYPAKLDLTLKKRLIAALKSKADAQVFESLASLFDEDELKKLLKSEYSHSTAGFFELNTQLTDFKNWLPKYGLLRTDKLSMAHALEVRVPYLNHLLVGSALKNGWGEPSFLGIDKKQFRNFCREVLKLPAKAVSRRKQPFFNPEKDLNKLSYQTYVHEVLSSEGIQKYGILNYDYVETLLGSGKSDFLKEKKIAAILIFQIWCEEYFPLG